MNVPFFIGFLKTLRILKDKDYLSVIVIGGGWAPFIYYRYVSVHIPTDSGHPLKGPFPWQKQRFKTKISAGFSSFCR